VYSRSIDGNVLTLSASGWTYDRLFVLYDYETESMWYDLPDTQGLTCIAGAYEGRVLPELPSAYVAWSEWKQEKPKSKVLTRQGAPE
jgi:hypothetical protein